MDPVCASYSKHERARSFQFFQIAWVLQENMVYYYDYYHHRRRGAHTMHLLLIECPVK